MPNAAAKMNLLSDNADDTPPAPAVGTGLLPSQTIRELVRQKEIQASIELDADQLQPASLDLRLGPTAYRVRASFLPGDGGLEDVGVLAVHVAVQRGPGAQPDGDVAVALGLPIQDAQQVLGPG